MAAPTMMGPVSASPEATVTRYLASACALSWLAWLSATRRRGQGAPATLSALVGTVRVFTGAWAVVGGLAPIALPPRRGEPRP